MAERNGEMKMANVGIEMMVQGDNYDLLRHLGDKSTDFNKK